jgi:hypothetical protein
MAGIHNSVHLAYSLGEISAYIGFNRPWLNTPLYHTDSGHKQDTIGGLEKIASRAIDSIQSRLTHIQEAIHSTETRYPDISLLDVSIRNLLPTHNQGLVTWITCPHTTLPNLLETFFGIAGTPDRIEGRYFHSIEEALRKHGKTLGPKMVGCGDRCVKYLPNRKRGMPLLRVGYTFWEVIDAN